MTPQERQLVDELFDRLARLEQAPREADAAAAINDGLRRAPNALYPLVQTVLLQEEALKRAHARLQDYEGGEQPQPRGFLDSMRDSLFGSGQQRGSVPSVGRGNAWNAPHGGLQQPQQQGGGFGGGSFLGTAAAAAAGVIGGTLLMNSLGSLMGGKQAFASEGGRDNQSPWGDSSNGDLGREAGAGDIASNRQGLFDSHDHDGHNDDHGGDDFDGDMGSGDGDF